ncbi:cation:proton antiporter [Mycobacterium sp. TY814]|uniref:cation:proton antiporter n=1 Tax=unclassified Mycobacterium TaxID=2642494 RepID=UPI00274087D6|nr:cation:proton antiporter [Mycobacterium sp. TY814]MDP7726288.1 cation:proton antiporter [Mycobacterium sp. TY814]
MQGFGFSTLALVTAIGFAGPLLAAVPRLRIPVVIGELLAGLAVGNSGFGIIDVGNATLQFLANIGFALVMFVVGTQIPVRGLQLRAALPLAGARAGLVAAVATALGLLLAFEFHNGHGALYAVLMASSSAALALPIIQSLKSRASAVVLVSAQIAVADCACILLLPLAIEPDRALIAALSALSIAGCAVAIFVLLREFDRRGLLRRVHVHSKKDRLALELRTSLLLLFALASVAVATRVSIMLSGFALGLAVAAVGEPRRLARQLFGITEGFFSPLFFVWLGASLQVRELIANPRFVLLGVGLGAGALIAHCAARFLGQPLTLAVLSGAQLGVPVAAATIGTERHLFAGGEAAALILGALITIGGTSIAGRLAARRHGVPS